MISVLFFLLCFVCCKTIYRLYLHPLRRFPGPKLAAASRFYEFYHNVIHNGKYLWKIDELHRKYGPVVRVGPNEIHINDPTYFSEIYAGNSRKRNKTKYWLRMLVILSDSIAATGEHFLHLKRRNHLLRHFSKKSVTQAESRMEPSIEKAMDIIGSNSGSGEIISIDSVMIAMGTDVVSEYILGKPLGFLNIPDFNNSLRHVLHSMSHYGPLMTFIPFGDMLRYLVPTALLTYFSPDIQVVMENERMVRSICAQELKSSGLPKSPFFSSLNDYSLPPSERSLDRITSETLLFLLAGTETTGWAIAVTIFYLLNDRSIFISLREELKQVLVRPKDYPTWTELETLPYLKGVIHEGLRLSLVAIHRLSLTADEALVYKDWTIPPGTAVGQSIWFVHMNDQLYPEPRKFKPERWLSTEATTEPSKEFFVPFLRGARDCIGKSLAYAEMYVTIALLVRRFDMELYETSLRDVTPYRDGIITHQADGSQGVRIKVTKILTD